MKITLNKLIKHHHSDLVENEDLSMNFKSNKFCLKPNKTGEIIFFSDKSTIYIINLQ